MSYIISESWDKVLKSQFEMQYMKNIQHRLTTDLQKRSVVVPKVSDIFQAYKATDFEKVKVIILGNDPHYTKNTADGLAFSSDYLSPALEIIFAEIKGCTGRIRTQTKLNDWAEQGVFLLNTILTGLQGRPLQHEGIGWEIFTRFTLTELNKRPGNICVLLWGSHAIKYKPLFIGMKHLVLTAPHPQSDNYGTYQHTFRGCNHFSMCNDFLQGKGLKQINWGDPIKPTQS